MNWHGESRGIRGKGERETDGRGLPTPGHATIWSSTSWMACFCSVGRWHWTLPRQPSHELLQYHFIDDFLDIAFLGRQPFAAGIPELLQQHKGSEVKRPEVLAVLLGTQADPLEDGVLKVFVEQEVLDWQLLCG